MAHVYPFFPSNISTPTELYLTKSHKVLSLILFQNGEISNRIIRGRNVEIPFGLHALRFKTPYIVIFKAALSFRVINMQSTICQYITFETKIFNSNIRFNL